jgi:ATP-dependent Clp protease ATP-binding subunit ClpB
MTSNLGSQVIQELAGAENYDRMKSAVMEIVGGHFRPEFVNRIDDIVVFHPLGKKQLRAITEIQTRYLCDRLAAREIGMEFTTAALDKLAEAGFDPVYGARPLKRAIQTQIENPLAQEILAGHFASGDVIVVDAGKEGLVFTRKEKSARRERAAS